MKERGFQLSEKLRAAGSEPELEALLEKVKRCDYASDATKRRWTRIVEKKRSEFKK